jgi:LAO/AO transport system kinase
VFVVNKADREGADAAVRDLEQMLRLGPELPWRPPVVKTAAATGEGVAELWDRIAEHRAYLEASGELERGRRLRLVREVESLAVESLRARVRALLDADAELVDDVLERRTDPYRAAARVLERLAGGGM